MKLRCPSAWWARRRGAIQGLQEWHEEREGETVRGTDSQIYPSIFPPSSSFMVALVKPWCPSPLSAHKKGAVQGVWVRWREMRLAFLLPPLHFGPFLPSVFRILFSSSSSSTPSLQFSVRFKVCRWEGRGVPGLFFLLLSIFFLFLPSVFAREMMDMLHMRQRERENAERNEVAQGTVRSSNQSETSSKLIFLLFRIPYLFSQFLSTFFAIRCWKDRDKEEGGVHLQVDDVRKCPLDLPVVRFP